MYVNINVQHSCKILQNYLKLLMSYQQEIVGGYIFGMPCSVIAMMVIMRQQQLVSTASFLHNLSKWVPECQTNLDLLWREMVEVVVVTVGILRHASLILDLNPSCAKHIGHSSFSSCFCWSPCLPCLSSWRPPITASFCVVCGRARLHFCSEWLVLSWKELQRSENYWEW